MRHQEMGEIVPIVNACQYNLNDIINREYFVQILDDFFVSHLNLTIQNRDFLSGLQVWAKNLEHLKPGQVITIQKPILPVFGC
jgi:hypothetical protein